jgi:hypothetical protein
MSRVKRIVIVTEKETILMLKWNRRRRKVEYLYAQAFDIVGGVEIRECQQLLHFNTVKATRI